MGVVSVRAQWQEADCDLVHTGSRDATLSLAATASRLGVSLGTRTVYSGIIFAFNVIRLVPAVVGFLSDSNQIHNAKETISRVFSLLGNHLMHKAICVCGEHGRENV